MPPTQQQQFDTALSGLTPTEKTAYTTANPTVNVGGVSQNYNTASSTYTPVSSLNSGNGATAIDSAVTAHNADMAKIPPPTTSTTPAPTSSTVNDTLKTQGGISLDEANLAKPDLTNYTYDPSTKYFMPKTTSADQTAVNTQYENDKKTINDAFAGQVAGMDAATQQLMQSIQGIYTARIADQQEANRRELATFNTMNTRYGTTRYAPGVAQGVLTADERVGLDRIQKIATEEASLVAQAQQSLTDKKYSAFVQQRNELNDLRKEKVTTLTKLQDNAYKVQQDNYKKAQDKITNDLNAKIHSDTVSYQDKQQAISEAQLSETVRKDKMAEAQKAADLKVKTDAANLISGAMASPVTKTNGIINPADQTKFLSSYTPAMQTQIKAVADYSIDPNSASKRVGAGISPLQLETLAKAYNPDYKAGNYKAISSFLTSWASGGNNSVVQSANTAIQHFGELANFADKLGNAPAGDLGPLTSQYNTVKQWAKQGAQDSNVLNFKQTAVLAATEMAKLVKNGSGSNAAPGEDEIRAQLETLTAGLSPDTAKSVIGNDIELLKDRLNTARENYAQVVGSDPGQILYPSATQTIKALQDKGYSIDMTSLSPSPMANVSDGDLVHGIVNPSSAATDPSTYFSSLLDIINQPAPADATP